MNFQFSKEERNKINADAEKSQIKYRDKKHKCYKPGCEDESIGSHSISESISLTKISDKDNLMKHFRSSRRGIESKKLVLVNKGIGEASVFHGFCSKHDNEFDYLDNNKYKYSFRQILLQCYRSVCYAVYNSKYYAAEFDSSSFDYMREFILNPTTLSSLTEDLNIHDENILENEVFLSQVKGLLEDSITGIIENFFSYEYQIFSALKEKIELVLDNIEDKKQEEPFNYTFEQSLTSLGFSVFYRRVEFRIPVAVVNHHLIPIKGRKTYLIFTVVPYEDSTEIYWLFDDKYYDFFSEKWSEMNTTELNILNRIESSMLHSEFWFIDPKVLESIPLERLNIIKEDINYNYDRHVFKDYDLSIFDELRLELIRYVNEPTRSSEHQKINTTVERKSEKEQEKLYTQFFISNILATINK